MGGYRLTQLSGESLRALHPFRLEPAATLNFIVGGNGSGKSTLLEALELLTSGRSHRANPLSQLLPQPRTVTSPPLLIRGRWQRFDSAIERQVAVRLTSAQQPLEIQLDQNPIYRSSALAAEFPQLLLSPERLDLIDGSPERRRSFLDWMLFHRFPDYHAAASSYHRALQQRNEWLKQSRNHANPPSPPEPEVWMALLAQKGGQIHQLRQQAVETLAQQLSRLLEPFLAVREPSAPNGEVKLEYLAGWRTDDRPAADSLREALLQHQPRDQLNGYSSVGPHRADLRIKRTLPSASPQSPSSSDYLMRDYASRGEKKRLNLLLVFAQLNELFEQGGKQPLLLLDDLFAELDEANSHALLAQIRRLQLQTFITTTSLPLATTLLKPTQGEQIFTLQEGIITPFIPPLTRQEVV